MGGYYEKYAPLIGASMKNTIDEGNDL